MNVRSVRCVGRVRHEFGSPQMPGLAPKARTSRGGVPLAGQNILAQRFSAGWDIVRVTSAVGTAHNGVSTENPVSSLRDSGFLLRPPRPEGRGYHLSRLRRLTLVVRRVSLAPSVLVAEESRTTIITID